MSVSVIESGEAEMGSQSQTPFGRRNESVNHIHNFTTIFYQVLKICLLVLCFEPPLSLIPYNFWGVGSRTCCRVCTRHVQTFGILSNSTPLIRMGFEVEERDWEIGGQEVGCKFITANTLIFFFCYLFIYSFYFHEKESS